MSHRTLFLVASALALAAAPHARAEIFALIPGIPGDVTAVGYEDQIDISSLGFSGGQVPRRSGQKLCAPPSSKTQISPLTIVKDTDRASAKLFAAAAQGTVFGDIRIAVVAIGAVIDEVARYELKNAFISSFETSSSGGRPTETIAFQFERMDLTSFNPEPDPPETASWDFCGVSP